MRWKRTIVVALAGLMLVSGAGTALAAQDAADEAAPPDLDIVKARVLERIADRIERFEQTIAELGGEPGVVAEQLVALAEEGVVIFEEAAVQVEEAESVREVAAAVKQAAGEFSAHRRVRRLYAHVQVDIDKFTRHLGRLDAAIARAEEAGVAVAEAAAESESAAAALEEAQRMMDAVDPSQTGPEVMGDLREAHATAHEGQQHIRRGWRALFAALPPAE